MTNEPLKKILQRKTGLIVSDKMDKTVVVEVTEYKSDSKYLKKYRSTKKYKVHDPENKHKCGEKVTFVACRPISKDKKWKLAD